MSGTNVPFSLTDAAVLVGGHVKSEKQKIN